MTQGMMGDCAREAPLFVQLSVDATALGEKNAEGGHDAHVDGVVVRVFAGEAKWLGQRLTCRVPVLIDGDDPAPSGTQWWPFESVRNARFLEAVLGGGEGPGPWQVVLGMGAPIAVPTDAPVEDYRTWVDPPAPAPTWSERLGPVAGLGCLVLFFAAGLSGLGWAIWVALRS